MKYLYLVLVLFICSCCAGKRDYGKIIADETFTFHITEVYKAKYTRVTGYILYKGIKIYTDNGSDGYYYKEYNLKKGQEIQCKLKIYAEYWENQTVLRPTEVDLTQYE